MDVRVLPSPYSPGRWSATVVLDGDVITTFDCRHLHHEPRTAARCIDKTRAAWIAWHTDSTETPIGKTPDGDVLFEVKKVRDRLTHARRYSVRVADRCPTCGVSLAEPPTTDDCPVPEDHAR